MKHILFLSFSILALASAAILGARALSETGNSDPYTPDGTGHALRKLWESYYAAESADRPRKQIEILSSIKAEAGRLRLAWDYWDASRKYVETSVRRNWKLRDTLNVQLGKEVEAFDEPIMTFLYRKGYLNLSDEKLYDFVVRESARLKSSLHKPFYCDETPVKYLVGGVLPDCISNDYEFALWYLLPKYRLEGQKIEDNEVYKDLRNLVGGSYPGGAYLEFMAANHIADTAARTRALEAFSVKFKGKAIGLYAGQELLKDKFRILSDNKASSSEFKAFDRDCRAFEKERSGFSSGIEKKISRDCREVESLVRTMNMKWCGVRVVDGRQALVSFQNADKAELVITLSDSEKKIFSKPIANPVGSFYVKDTVKVDLPRLDDGSYMVSVKYGSQTNYDSFSHYTLSLSARRDSRGYGIYVADYKTGAPLEKVDLFLFARGKLVGQYKDFVLHEGVNLLPDSMQKAIKGDIWYELQCTAQDDGLVRSSMRLSLSGSEDDQSASYKQSSCAVFTDRSAFNPGDTVAFKAILYNYDEQGAGKVAESGLPVEADLLDSEGNKIQTLKLETNDFGSVSGQFPLPKGLRNGFFSVNVSSGPYSGSHDFRVDEFVLPSFYLEFAPEDRLYLPGDTVSVKARARSYTGHSLSGAVVEYQVRKYDMVFAEGRLSPEGDGGISFDFVSDADMAYQWFEVAVKITDKTGETHEYKKWVSVSSAVRVSMKLKNAADARMREIPASRGSSLSRRGRDYSVGYYVMDEDKALFELTVNDHRGNKVPVPVKYELKDEKDRLILQGETLSGETVEIDLSGSPSGMYKVGASASVQRPDGKEPVTSVACCKVLKINKEDRVLDAPVKELFYTFSQEVAEGEEIRLKFGSADGPVWAVAEIFGENRILLDAKTFFLDGERGESGSIVDVTMPYPGNYPPEVFFRIFYFKDGEFNSYEKEFRIVRKESELPLSFSSFEDRTLPSTEYTFGIKTLPGVECVAAIFDKSTEAIAANAWNRIYKLRRRVLEVPMHVIPGRIGDYYGENILFALEDAVAGGVPGVRIRGKASMSKAMSDAAPMMQVSEAAIAEDNAAEGAADGEKASGLEVRDYFASTLAFEPFMRSGDNGEAELHFRTSGKLSTYAVQVFAHSKDMANNVLRRETVVSVPVKVSLSEPRYLYAGDRYEMEVSVSGMPEASSAGTLSLYQYDGEDYKNLSPVSVSSVKLEVPSGGSVSHRFKVIVPGKDGSVSGASSGERIIGLKAVFVSDGQGFSDGVFVKIPVYRNVQVLTEAHSGVLLPGMSRDELLEAISGAFVNVSPVGAETAEISIIDMVKAAVPSKAEPAGDNVLDLSEAYYIRLMAAKLGVEVSEDKISTDKILERIMACRNADGGFSWFEGMSSSPVLTSVMLERFAKLRDAGLIAPLDLESSVRFLDRSQFNFEWPFWCGGVSSDQYMYVRSLYPAVKFEVKPTYSASEFRKRMDNFKKYVREYLVPSKARGMNGYILGTARRLRTLGNLLASSDGIALAKSWGVNLGTEGRMRRSLEADVVSLLEYAVEHRDGGMYYPNAVMPFRGLLESEAYAHSLICDLMSAYAAGSSGSEAVQAEGVADGIRIWLMLQKETQQWDTEPAFIDALNSVLSGSDKVKSVKVLIMKKTYEKPFSGIKAAGNGFTVSRKFYREVAGEVGKEPERIMPGAVLAVGDKITAVYEIWNAENRSFVRLRAPREASLNPVQQLSGYYGMGIRPMRVNGWFSFAPGGYRNVKASVSEFFFDSYPEEKTTVKEEFFVTRAGVFEAPVPEIECLYSPHYRANGGFPGALTVE